MVGICILHQKIDFWGAKKLKIAIFVFYKFAFQTGYFALVLISTLARLYKNPITHHFL